MNHADLRSKIAAALRAAADLVEAPDPDGGLFEMGRIEAESFTFAKNSHMTARDAWRTALRENLTWADEAPNVQWGVYIPVQVVDLDAEGAPLVDAWQEKA